MSQLPLHDARGVSLLSFVRLAGDEHTSPKAAEATACSLVIVEWDNQVLLGFNVSRNQWELPGGSVESGESSRDAALRELEEETGIRAERITRVAQADLLSSGEATTYRADVFVVVLDNAPILLVSDELNDFRWWDPTLELWNGLNILDAEVIRRTHK